MINYVSAEEAISFVKSGDRVFLHGSACTPNFLIDELTNQADRLNKVEIVSISIQGDIKFTHPKYKDNFFINALFVSAPIREAVNNGQGGFVPVFLSEIPLLFKRNVLPLDVAIVTVSPPDKHGYCTLGASVDVARAAVDSAKIVIAQVNSKMLRSHGDALIHVERIDKMVSHDTPLMTIDYGAKAGTEEKKIGEIIAEMIDDRSTLQMGIGTIPDCVLKSLTNHKDLGVHTEMLSDGIVDLVKNDIITNKYKGINANKSITAFCFGTQRLYDYVDDNPAFSFQNVEYVNDPAVIRQNNKLIAINSAVEIDLTGQVCSDSIGMYQYSGIGGQMDFMRGAALSEGGKPIIAITARTKRGVSRITPFLKQGAGVVTTRGHVHYVVTEYGKAYLYGKNLRERAKALIKIAHPDDRVMLEKSAFERFKSY